MNRRELGIKAIVGVLLLATGCAFRSGWNRPPHPNLNRVTYVTGLNFPASSKLLHYAEKPDFMGREVIAKVELDARRSGAFIGALRKYDVSALRADRSCHQCGANGETAKLVGPRQRKEVRCTAYEFQQQDHIRGH